MRRKPMHKLVKANPGFRTLAAVIDFLIACFIGLGIFALVQLGFMNSKTGKRLTSDIHDYQVDSGLYYDDENGDLAIYEDYSNYERYEGIMINYYLVYLPKMNKDIAYDNYWYNVFVLGLKDEKNLYDEEELRKIQEPSKDCVLWQYQVMDGMKNYDLIGVPEDSLYVDGKLTDEAKTRLLRFYCSNEERSVYYNAVQDLFNQPFFLPTYNKAAAYNLIYPLSISIPIALLIIYAIIPLCFKNGETLSKKMFHLCLVNKCGFRIKKLQILLRSLPSIALIVILVLFLPLVYSVSIISIGMFASYLCSLFTKEKKAVHDMIAGTMVVNERDSVFYDDLAAQEAGEKFYKERMAHAEQEIEEGRKALEDEERAKWKKVK